MKGHVKLGAQVVSFIGGASVLLAAFVLYLQVFPSPFRHIQLPKVLAINCGIAAIGLLLLHLVLAVVAPWRDRGTTFWVLVTLGGYVIGTLDE